MSTSSLCTQITYICPSKNISLFSGHFQPRGQYTPECRKGLGQDVSSADEIGLARVIAGDTSKSSPSRLRRSSLPQAGQEVPLGLTAIGKTRFSDARHSIRRPVTVYRNQR
jgi:hypothetical protein